MLCLQSHLSSKTCYFHPNFLHILILTPIILLNLLLSVPVQVWRPHLAALGCDSESVLVVDVHRGHLSNQFRDDLSSISTDSIIIPSGCCCRLQPLDVCVTPVLRDFLQVLSPDSSDSPHSSDSSDSPHSSDSCDSSDSPHSSDSSDSL